MIQLLTSAVFLPALLAAWPAQPGAAQPATENTVFVDDFSGSADRWSPLLGTWQVNDQEYYETSGAPQFIKASLVREVECDGCAIQVDIPGLDETIYGRGIVFAYQNEHDFYYFWVCDAHDKLELVRYSADGPTGLATTYRPVETGKRYSLRVVLTHRIQCYFGEELVLDVAAAAPPLTGQVGLMTHLVETVVYFDNFRVEALSDPSHETRFLRGDVNDDGTIDISDAIRLLNWLFLGGEQVPCKAAGDANGDGTLDISDAPRLLRYVFSSGSPPVAPFPHCGVPPETALECETPPESCAAGATP